MILCIRHLKTSEVSSERVAISSERVAISSERVAISSEMVAILRSILLHSPLIGKAGSLPSS